MSQAVWQLQQDAASLSAAHLQATLQLRRPGDGLVDVKLGDVALAQNRFLGIDVPRAEAASGPNPADCYVRGSALVVYYGGNAEWLVEVDAMWRGLTPAASSGWLAAIELVVSVRTALLDSRPQLFVGGAISAEENWRLTDLAGPRWEAVGLSPGGSGAVWGSTPGCFLFRWRQRDLSYVEMVHPADFCRDELARDPGDAGRVFVTHRLFSPPLEKGVLLRGRVRGILIPGANDRAIAAEAYAQFAAEEPLLGSY